jgi:hypothetical protein
MITPPASMRASPTLVAQVDRSMVVIRPRILLWGRVGAHRRGLRGCSALAVRPCLAWKSRLCHMPV